jgi:hypothetical protein
VRTKDSPPLLLIVVIALFVVFILVRLRALLFGV